MKQTLSINQQVWMILQKDLAMQKDIARRLINIRALAKYLIQKYDFSAGIDAVISAIRRFESQNTFSKEEKELEGIFKDGIVSTKNNIACITLDMTFKKFIQRMKE